MKAMLKIGLLGLAGLLLVAIPASAQLNWSGSAYLGYAKATNDGAPDGSISGRANAFAMVNPVFGIGAEIGHMRLGTLDEPGVGEFSISTWNVTANAIARGVVGSMKPYGIVGIGAYPVRFSDGTNSLTNTDLGLNIGGGINFAPSPGPVSFGIEGRYHTIPSPSDSDEAFNMLMFSGGIFFR